jgi:dihydroxyacetone kinase
VVLLVNNLGGTPTMELAVVTRRAVSVLEGQGLTVERVYLGTFLSALEMAGVSLTMLPVDDGRLALLDAPTDAPAWPNAAARPRRRAVLSVEAPPVAAAMSPAVPPRPQTALGQAMASALTAAAQALIAAAPRLTELDRVVGDGDLGISLERGARAVLQELPLYALDEPSVGLRELSSTLQRSLGGTSGPLYAAFLLRAAGVLGRRRADDPAAWAEAFRAGCDAIADLGGAAPGERTMLDALVPASIAFQQTVTSGRTAAEALRAAAAAAASGAGATAEMLPRRGRSSYLGERCLGHADPGAEAVAIWLGALVPS